MNILNGTLKNDCAVNAEKTSKITHSSLYNRRLMLDAEDTNDFINKRSTASAVEKNGYFLWILTPVAASFSVIIVIAALAGPMWLITDEKLINSNFKMGSERFTMSKCTKSSLWIICSAIVYNSTNCTIQSIQDIDTYSCMKIDYFPREEYRTDAHDSTSAIPYTIIKACPFFIASGVILVVSFVIFLIPTIFHQNNLYYFAAGILFIVSGLLMLIGLIVYISIFKSEIGSKLRSKSAFEPPIFRFSYGKSFFLYVSGFISTEFVGVLNIFLYISLLQIENNKEEVPCLHCLTFRRKTKQSPRTCQKLDPQLICKKHAIPINLLFDSESSKRYYFAKLNKIDDNSQNLAKSLNELYTEPAPTFSSFDLPLYNEFPLTRSVSTTTEIFLENHKKSFRKNYDIDKKEHYNDMCGLSAEITKGIRKTKDDLVNEFFKRTGVRPKAKNIYFIQNPDETSEGIFVTNNYSKTKKNQQSSKELSGYHSNSSLRNQNDKFQTKSLINLNQYNPTDLNKYDDCFLKNRFHNDYLYHSRTLPRSFMKANLESSQYLTLPDKKYIYSKRGFKTLNRVFNNSCDDINFPESRGKATNNGLVIQWPQAIPASPSYSVKSSNFYNSGPSRSEKLHQHINLIDYTTQKKSLSYFGNNYQISNLAGNESFDLDQIEKDCRISHASLFEEGNYDVINGTAV